MPKKYLEITFVESTVGSPSWRTLFLARKKYLGSQKSIIIDFLLLLDILNIQLKLQKSLHL